MTSALTGQCNDGTPCTFQMVTPKALGPSALLLSATTSLKIDDRVTVKESNGNPATIANLGTATLQIGTDGHLGDIWSLGPVTVADRTVVNGTIHGAVTVTTGNSVTIKAKDHTAFTTTTATSSVTFPTANAGGVDLEPGRISSLAPGAYGAIAVKSSSTLNIRTGSYLFESLDLEPSSTLALNTTAGPITIYVRGTTILRGTITTKTDARDFTLVYLGSQVLSVEAPLAATVIAPQATVNITSVQPISGAFFAASIEVFPGDTVTHVATRNPVIAAREGLIQAESFDSRSGGDPEGTVVNQLSGGVWLLYRGVDYGAPGQYQRIRFQLTSPTGVDQIVVKIDSLTGTTIASLQTFPTGSALVAESEPIPATVSGVHDTYIIFNGTESDSLDWFELITAPKQTIISATAPRGPVDAATPAYVLNGPHEKEGDIPENINWLRTTTPQTLAPQAGKGLTFTPDKTTMLIVQVIATGLVPPVLTLLDQNQNPIQPLTSITVAADNKVVASFGPVTSQPLSFVVTNPGASSASFTLMLGLYAPPFPQ